MIAIAAQENAQVEEKNPDCCTALRGRKSLDVQTNLMVSHLFGCE